MLDQQKIKLIATDLDGTFLRDDKSISERNMASLYKLGEKNVLRVIATGRNLRKTKEVIPPHAPFDYLVFSSGAGVIDWQSGDLLYHQNIDADTVTQLSAFFHQKKIGFHLFRPVPENYRCWVFPNEIVEDEFDMYTFMHQKHAEMINSREELYSEAAQYLVILPEDLSLFEELKAEILSCVSNVKVVRTSSPLGSGKIWMEIFHQDVSKGNGVRFLCKQMDIDRNMTLGLGNDYNDLDLLDFTAYSYVVANAPDDLKKAYQSTASNENDAFACITGEYL